MLDVLDRLDIFLVIVATLIATAAGVHSVILRRALDQRALRKTAQTVEAHDERMEKQDVIIATLRTENRKIQEALEKLADLPLLLEREYQKKSDAPCHDDVRETARRLAVLETSVQKNSGLADEISDIHERINDVARSTSEQAGQLKQINTTLHLIQEHLIGGR